MKHRGSNKKTKISTKLNTKHTWEQIIKKNEKMIAESWKSQNPQKTFSNKIKKLYKEYNGKKPLKNNAISH
jgi:hypothetical protein